MQKQIIDDSFIISLKEGILRLKAKKKISVAYGDPEERLHFLPNAGLPLPLPTSLEFIFIGDQVVSLERDREGLIIDFKI